MGLPSRWHQEARKSVFVSVCVFIGYIVFCNIHIFFL